MAEEIERSNERRFAQVVFNRKTPVTWTLVGANVALFFIMAYVANSTSPSDPSYQVAMMNFGAKLSPLIDQGEWWRLVMPAFIHIGLLHLFINMYSLSVIGPLIEQLYGSGRYLVLYILSGVGGVAASHYFTPVSLAAGASGALFGLLGVLFVFGIKYRNELPGGFRRSFSPMRLVPVLALNLFITFAIPFIDKWGHLGGLFVGAALALVVPYARTSEKWSGVVWWAASGLCGLVVAASFFMAYTAPKRTISDLERLLPAGQEVSESDRAALPVNTDLIEPYNETTRTLVALANAVGSGKGADGGDVVADAQTAANRAQRASGVDARSRELFARQAELLERGVSLLSGGRDEPTAQERKAFVEDVRRLQEDWQTWFESEGQKYGFKFREQN